MVYVITLEYISGVVYIDLIEDDVDQVDFVNKKYGLATCFMSVSELVLKFDSKEE
jgi:hypothetical protein